MSSKTPVTIPVVPTNETPKIVPVIVPPEPTLEPEVVTEEKKETTPVSPVVNNTSVDTNLPKKISETMNHYSNSNFRYEFDIPANVYYS
jgi:hypothetical protein